MHTVTCCHTLTGALQTDTHKDLSHTHTLTHGASQEAMGPVGQSLRVWFVCLDLIIETGLFLQPPLLFLYSYMREGGGERARERERERKQSFDSIS